MTLISLKSGSAPEAVSTAETLLFWDNQKPRLRSSLAVTFSEPNNIGPEYLASQKYHF